MSHLSLVRERDPGRHSDCGMSSLGESMSSEGGQHAARHVQRVYGPLHAANNGQATTLRRPPSAAPAPGFNQVASTRPLVWPCASAAARRSPWLPVWPLTISATSRPGLVDRELVETAPKDPSAPGTSCSLRFAS
ncbi:hypothetical protein IQ07DRAFT_605810 [Pyrenochaeta sp. DS3sAY3a]|nr:hypothetical protein IQ07DRAFT_605810 [Pyrenochaeta sp. DS3sAY3a]